MSVKRQATTELNHENWDKEDSEEPEEIGTFKTASKEILEKRVIITAKRRTQGTSDETKKSVFSGFGGFNKTKPSSFDFLSKLTNGSKNADNENTAKNDTSVSSSLFSSKPATGSQAAIFGSSTASPVKSSLGSSTTPATGNLFSSTAGKTSSSVFPAIKADSTVSDSPFKTQSATSPGVTTGGASKFSTTTTTSQVTSNIFGVSSTSGTTTIPGKSLFATTNNSSSLFKTQSTSSPSISNTNTTANTNNSEKKSDDKNDDKKITYYTKLKGLNESVSDWIKKHVEETPLCILTPIFKDYEKYLKEIQDEYESPAKENPSKASADKSISQSTPPVTNNTSPAKNIVSSGSFTSKTESPTAKPSIFGTQNNSTTFGDKPTGFSFGSNTTSSATTTTASSGFSFGSNTSTNSTGTTTSTGFTFGSNLSTNPPATTAAGFSFGITSTSVSTTTTSSPFSFTPNKTTNTNGGAAPFSFGIGKPFSFSSNVTQKVENTDATNNGNDAQEDEDTPPKVEFTPIAEENSVFDKRCKIFHKKDGNFVDMGVGTLYIKKIDDSDKHQLLVRAHTTLGNVLLNVRLSSAIPTQRMGKNNVMLVCIPTPTFKPPPTPVLIRVKTSEEADELLETLNKYKS